MPGGPKGLDAHRGPGTQLGPVQADTAAVPQVTHRRGPRPDPFLRNAENTNTQSGPEKQQKCLEERGVTPNLV